MEREDQSYVPSSRHHLRASLAWPITLPSQGFVAKAAVAMNVFEHIWKPLDKESVSATETAGG